MKFKTYLYFLFGIMLMAGSAIAQPNTKKDIIEGKKVAFITQKLSLNTKEAESFWPLYNEYQQKRDNLYLERRKMRKDVKENFDNMTDKELETLVDAELDLKQKELDLAKDFNKKMKAVLSMKKVALYYQALEEFNRKLFEESNKLGPKGK